MKAQYKNIHQEIIDRCKLGNREAQFELYRLYYKSMYNTSLRIVGNENDAEDIMQESFLNALIRINKYEGKVSFGAWLKKIVINRSLDYLKKKQVIFEEIDNIPMEEVETENLFMETQEFNLKRIRDAILQLPEGYRIVLSLYLIEGYDHEEISGILNISNASSRSQLLRAKRKLKFILSKDEVFSFN